MRVVVLLSLLEVKYSLVSGTVSTPTERYWGTSKLCVVITIPQTSTVHQFSIGNVPEMPVNSLYQLKILAILFIFFKMRGFVEKSQSYISVSSFSTPRHQEFCPPELGILSISTEPASSTNECTRRRKFSTSFPCVGAVIHEAGNFETSRC
ncbi:hypothetical protein BKA64DRAFT_650063 [Cadophora sp. MPI-SDFR-AT-0126]|nr:hypothetical protein BKA64DRAFT_650063 [Leotiomycetes sp. MPI-SDFR-AT-0126]